jgi:Zn-dependent protease
VCATLLLVLIIHLQRLVPALMPSLGVLARMAQFGVLINLVLAFFNLIPIPPLDGSHVLYHLLPPRLGMAYRNLQQYGMLILLAVMFLARPIFGLLMTPAFVLYGFAMYVVQLWT